MSCASDQPTCASLAGFHATAIPHTARNCASGASLAAYTPATFTSARFPTLSCRTHRSAQTCLAIFAHGASTPSTVAGSPNPSTLLFPSIAARRPCQTISSEGTVHTGGACQRSARSGAGEEKKTTFAKRLGSRAKTDRSGNARFHAAGEAVVP
ncbi:hypothetical protein L1887_50293 [Cichorium endivia]|nr:hypothetical protein L1887_50293 [Cichorium endivia]